MTGCEHCDKAGHRCIICENKTESTLFNPQLCCDCQGWDDLTHLFLCQHNDYPQINPGFFNGTITVADHISGFLVEKLESRGLNFRPLEFFSPSKDCLLCAAIGEAVRHHLGGSTNARVATWRPFFTSPIAFDRSESGSQSPLEPFSKPCILPIGIYNDSPGDKAPLQMTLALELMLHYSGPGHTLKAVTEWDRSTIDLDLIKTWLANPIEHHEPLQDAFIIPMSLPPSFRLIDTHRWCITVAQQPVTYLALSYVWSAASSDPEASNRDSLKLTTANVNQLEKPNSLRNSRLPEVITDAIQLCSDLGQQYIWIDQLCIIQDDWDLKKVQIDAMDTVYNRATMTIVALGEGPTIGLPGTSSRPRPRTLTNNHTWHLWLNSSQSGAKGTSIHDAVSLSLWNKRGWTYQERVLSRRHLFIGERNIYRNPQDGVLYEKGISFGHPFPGYSTAVKNYTSRKLSHDIDSLNAFLGVGNVFAAQHGTNLINGLPEKYFLQALLWRHQATWRPRQLPDKFKIPSWSWAAFEGSVHYEPALWAFGDLRYSVQPSSEQHIANIIQFYYADPTKGLRAIEEKATGSKCYASDGADALQQYIKWPHELAQHGTVSDYMKVANIAPETLVFQSSVASLILEESHTNLDHGLKEDGSYLIMNGNDVDDVFNEWSSTRRSEHSPAIEQKSFLIADKQGTLVGATFGMEINQARNTIAPGKEYQVVVVGLSRSNRKLADSVLSGWGLLVMITEIQEGGSRRRLALGSVDIEAWASIQPRWEVIVLS